MTWKRLTLSLSALVMSVLLITGISCNTTPTGSGVASYRAEAVVIIDPNLSMAKKPVKVLVRFELDSAIYNGGDITFGGKTLVFNDPSLNFDSLYSFTSDSIYVYANTAQTFALKDGTKLKNSFTASIPDSFTIGTITDPLIQNNFPINIDWNGSARAEAYVLATVKASKAYTGAGWSQFNDTQVPGGSIPPAEAFATPDSLSRDTGLYNIYVYAISGSPTPEIANRFLPVPLPGQYSDNIAQTDLTGRVSGIHVTLYDTVRVVQQP